MRFKEFLLNESKAYLGQKVGDILTAAQELQQDSGNMGSRDLTRFSERIVNQIRRVLHSNWPKEEKKHLVSLQKIGVALMRSIDKKDDLPGVIASVSSSLEKLVADLGTPINKFATTDTPPTRDDSSTAKPQGQNQPDTTQDQSVAPMQQQTMDQSGPVGPPAGSTGQDMYSPPLGGSSGPMDGF